MLVLRSSVVAIALLLPSPVLVAQDANETTLSEQRLAALIGRLNDPSWATRQEATRMLGDPNEGYELGMLAETLERDDLSPETRGRLWSAARSLFEQSPKAGLGVGFGAVRDGGIEIRSVVEDVDSFPAAAMLMPGDLIVGAEGLGLTSSEDLRAVILSHEPGELLNLLVERGGQVLDLDLPLGSFGSLRGAAPMSPMIADRAIQLRWSRRGITIPEPPTAGGGISADDWVSAGYPEPPGPFRATNARRTPSVVQPGSAREVHVGVGVLTRGRIEPWSNRANAEGSMDQTRRIVLSRQMDIARTRIKLLNGGLETLKVQVNENPDDPRLMQKVTAATNELRAAERDLARATMEFNSIAPTP
tara:strand:- start:333793 stop:334875 length:1083 start_codon:yes stop_codon:yes gene_type:complete